MTTVTLPFTAPFDAAAALGNLRAHAIPGAERVDDDSITRLVGTPSGRLVVRVRLTADAVTADIGSEEPTDIESVTAVVRRWFDLELNPSAVFTVLGPDPVIGPLIGSRPGLRVIGTPDGFETAVMAVLGQQVSLAAARTFGGRLVAAYGTVGPDGLTGFPAAEAIAAATPEALRLTIGLTGARGSAVHALAVACASGLQIMHGTDPDEFRPRLLALPGIGPWTADYLTVRVLGDRDAFTASDLVLRRALGNISVKAAAAASEAWRPYRAYALFHLWTSTSY